LEKIKGESKVNERNTHYPVLSEVKVSKELEMT
jgi:hypothetical protein